MSNRVGSVAPRRSGHTCLDPAARIVRFSASSVPPHESVSGSRRVQAFIKQDRLWSVVPRLRRVTNRLFQFLNLE